jgi:hemolysin III
MLLTAPAKPKLRGISHLIAFVFALALATFLIFFARPGLSRFAISVYAVTLACMFGVSALYHVPHWQPKTRKFLKRLDHATIFIFIAGSYTPLCLLVLDSTKGILYLKLVWTVALLGVAQSIFWIKAPKLISFGIYFLLGWILVPIFPGMIKTVGTETVLLILMSGITYTAGALIYGFRRPDPWPKTFGYHEIFHLLVIIGVAAYVFAILRMVYQLKI